MMMNNTLKSLCKVSPGTIIEGKWHRNRYTIIRELGWGANGIVYLAQCRNQQVALKMSDNGMSVTSEVNVLKSFAKVQGSALGPSLLDVDDWERKDARISFYAMEYIHGPDLLGFIRQKGPSWTEVLLSQLLSDLEKLHQSGWVFGDLKPENLIVTSPPPRIRCIDVGGTTIKGRAIKEFTEFYDRGYWGLGTRKADPQYDLFAAAMVLINLYYPKRFNKTAGGIGQLRDMIRQNKELMKYELMLMKALEGRYASAAEMRKELLALPAAGQPEGRTARRSAARNQAAGPRPAPSRTRQGAKDQKKKGGFLETVLIVFVISVLYFVYIYGQLV